METAVAFYALKFLPFLLHNIAHQKNGNEKSLYDPVYNSYEPRKRLKIKYEVSKSSVQRFSNIEAILAFFSNFHFLEVIFFCT